MYRFIYYRVEGGMCPLYLPFSIYLSLLDAHTHKYIEFIAVIYASAEMTAGQNFSVTSHRVER